MKLKNAILFVFMVVMIQACSAATSTTSSGSDDSSDQNNSGNNLDVELYLPFPEGDSYVLSQGYNGTFSHQGCYQYALDFDVPENSEIVSVAAGRVMAVKEDSTLSGTSTDYRDKTNYIHIDHGSQIYSTYDHICTNCAVVEPGDLVEQGQLIGYSGNTGYSTGPHLHFQIDSWSTACSISYGFADVTDEDGIPLEGQTYTSQNDGSSSQSYTESTIPGDFFEFNDIVVNENMDWTLTPGQTITLTGQSQDASKTWVAIFLMDPSDGSWADGSSTQTDSDGSFTLTYTVSESLSFGSYWLALDASATDYYMTEQSVDVYVSSDS